MRCKTEQNRCIAGPILGRVLKIREYVDSVKFEFANDLKCANGPIPAVQGVKFTE